MPTPDQDPVKDAEKAADAWAATCKPTPGGDINKEKCLAARQNLQEALARAKVVPYKDDDIQLLNAFLKAANLPTLSKGEKNPEKISEAISSAQLSLGLIGKNGDVKPGVAVGILGQITITALREKVASLSAKPQASLEFSPQHQANLVAIARVRPLTLDGRPIQITLATVTQNKEQTLKAFQQSAGINPTGQFDEATQKSLALHTWLRKLDMKEARISFVRYEGKDAAGKAGLLKVSLKGHRDFEALPKEVEQELTKLAGVKNGQKLEDAIQQLQVKHFGQRYDGMTFRTMGIIRQEAARTTAAKNLLEVPLSQKVTADLAKTSTNSSSLSPKAPLQGNKSAIAENAFNRETLISLKHTVAHSTKRTHIIGVKGGERYTLKYLQDPMNADNDQIEITHNNKTELYLFNWSKLTVQLVGMKATASQRDWTRINIEIKKNESSFFSSAAKLWELRQRK